MWNGERMKIYWNSTLAWAIGYGEYGQLMTLSPDSSYLITSSLFNSAIYLGKLNSSNGDVLASFNSSSSDYYMYIYASDERALCIHVDGWF